MAEEAGIEPTLAARLTTVLKTAETTRSHQLPRQSIQQFNQQSHMQGLFKNKLYDATNY